MKTFQIKYENAADFKDRLCRIKSIYDESKIYDILFYLTWTYDAHDPLYEAAAILEEVFPDAVYYGNEASGSIIDGDPVFSVGVTCYLFENENTHVELLWVEEGTEYASLQDLWDHCRLKKDLCAVELIPSISYLDQLKIENSRADISKDVLVFGGASVDYTNPTYDADVMAKGHPITQQGMPVILYYGKELHFLSSYVLGWKGLGRSMTVTRSLGKQIYEIDNVPAYSIYEKYLNLSNDDKDTLVFPLIVEEDGVEYIRTPQAVLSDKSMKMFANIEEGLKARIAYGDKNTILSALYRESEKIASFRPQAIKAFSCGARRLFWGDDEVGRETRPLQNIAPTCGFYTGGEILRFANKLKVLNSTLVIISIREGNTDEVKSAYIPSDAAEDKSLISRLAYFASTISEEQADEYAHVKLRADVSDALVNSDSNPIELLERFVDPLRELFKCDQVIYCDTNETRVISNSPVAASIWPAPIEFCRKCEHFNIYNRIFADGVSEVPRCEDGLDGVPVNPDCPVKSMLTRIVYCDDKPVGYLSVHYINYYHEFNNQERETLASAARILSLALSRYVAKTVNDTLIKREEERKRQKEVGLATAFDSVSETYDYIVYIDPANNEAIRLRASDKFAGILDGIDPYLPVQKRLDAFFKQVIYPKDYNSFVNRATKETAAGHAKDGSADRFECRMVINGIPEWYHIKITGVKGSESAQIIGILNINDDVLLREKLEIEEKQLEYTAVIDSFSRDFECIDFVRLNENHMYDAAVTYRASEKLNKLIPGLKEEINFSKRLDLLMNHFVAEEDRKLFFAKTRRGAILKALSQRGIYYVDFKANDSGGERFCQLKFVGNTDKDGTLYAFVAGLHDIDQEAKREIGHSKALASSITSGNAVKTRTAESYMNAISDSLIVHNIPAGFFVYCDHDDGEIIYFNDLMVDLFGCSSGEDFVDYVNNTFRGIVHPEDYDRTVASIYSQIRNDPRGIYHAAYRIIRKDGEVKTIDDYGRILHFDDLGDVFFVCAADATEHNRIYEDSGEEKIFNNLSVLLVDDDDYSRSISREILEIEGANVIEAASGSEAVNAVNTVNAVAAFDLILMDIVMPGMDGVRAIREIRNEHPEMKIPIFAFTTDATEEMKQRCIEAGADGFTNKPLNIIELSKKLIVCMKRNSADMDKQLESVMHMANTDPLTGAKNITAYTLKVGDIENTISRDTDAKFAVVMCDINNLKMENDTYGHGSGDEYIRNCYNVISSSFAGVPVYRIGGDEFVVVLQGEDYDRRIVLLRRLYENVQKAMILDTVESGRASLAAGMAEYDSSKDKTVSDVMKKADESMYRNKAYMNK